MNVTPLGLGRCLALTGMSFFENELPESQGEYRDDHEDKSDDIRDAECGVPMGVVIRRRRRQACERAPVVADV